MSERRACTTIGAARSTVRYRHRRPDDVALRARLRELADQRRRFGYRRLHVLLRLEGHVVNRKKTQRLYREEGLAVRRRRSRRRIAVARTPIPRPDGPNSRWSLDFMHDQLANGRRFRVLNIIDDVTKECLAAIPFAIGLGPMAARWLTLALGQAGGARVGQPDRPARPAPDPRQRQRHGVHLRGGAGLHPGDGARLALHRARQADSRHAFSESFQGRMRDECLNEHLFFSMGHARAVIAGWVTDYNTRRPHSAIGYQTPAAPPH